MGGLSPVVRGLGCGHLESPPQPPTLGGGLSAWPLQPDSSHRASGPQRHTSRKKGSPGGGCITASDLALTVTSITCTVTEPHPDSRGRNLDPVSQRGSFSVCLRRACGMGYISVAIFGKCNLSEPQSLFTFLASLVGCQ